MHGDSDDDSPRPKTPDTKVFPTIVKSTPIVAKRSHSLSTQYEDAQLSFRHKILAEENGCLDDVPIDFLWNFVPNVNEVQLEAITDKIASPGGVLLKRKGWHKFLGNLGTNEHAVYDEPVATIVNAIIEAAHELDSAAKRAGTKGQVNDAKKKEEKNMGRKVADAGADSASKPRVVLKCQGNITHVSESPDSNKPDGSLELNRDYCKTLSAEIIIDGKERTQTENVMLCTQFKISSTKADLLHDNYLKIIHDGLRMLKDPCRRFAFGFTIEGRRVRIYFFSRALMFRTVSLDINKDHVHLIKFFASLAVASDIELGWDTTIRRVSTKNDGIQYQIQVGQNWYQTCGKPLHDFRANNIVGRGTRVYKVHPMKLVDNQLVVADNTITYVLKDVWMERDEKQEAIKIKRIRHALKQWRLAYPDAPDAANFTYDPAFDKDYKIEPTWFEAPGDNPHAFDDDAPPQFAGHTWGSDPWDKYFPLVRDHGNVKVGLEGKVDSFRNMMKDNGFDMLYKQVVLRSRDNSSLPVDEESRMDSFGVARLRDAIHYREVFEHVGVRLDEVSSLSDVCEGLRDAAIGLRWLFRIGWMHRDLSMGNILTVTIVINGMPVNVAQLTDFEYSQPIHDQDEDEYQQTGTPDFMAIEVENKGVWAFDETSIEDDDEDLAASVMAYQAALADQAATKQGDLGGSSSNQRVRANPPPPQAQPETLPPFHFTILKVYSTSRDWQREHYSHIFVERQKEVFLSKAGSIRRWKKLMAHDVPENFSFLTGQYSGIARNLVEGYQMLEASISKTKELNHLAYSDHKTPRKIVEGFSKLAFLAKRVVRHLPLYMCLSFEDTFVARKRAREETLSLDEQDVKKQRPESARIIGNVPTGSSSNHRNSPFEH